MTPINADKAVTLPHTPYASGVYNLELIGAAIIGIKLVIIEPPARVATLLTKLDSLILWIVFLMYLNYYTVPMEVHDQFFSAMG